MEESIITSYGKNTKLLEKLKLMIVYQLSIMTRLSTLLLFIVCGAFVEIGSSWIELEEVNPTVLLVIIGICVPIYFIALRSLGRKDYSRSNICVSILYVIWIFMSCFLLFNGIESAIDGWVIAFIIITVIEEIVTVVCGSYENKKKLVISANIERSYLELKPDMVCGIYFNGVETPGDGVYFEIGYDDIKDVRADESAPDSGKYYNLFIDHKNGTYKLSIEKPKTALKTLKMIKDSLEIGEDPFEEIKEEEAVETQRHNWELSPEPLRVEKNSEGLVCCPTCGRWQNGENKACFRCGQKFIND